MSQHRIWFAWIGIVMMSVCCLGDPPEPESVESNSETEKPAAIKSTSEDASIPLTESDQAKETLWHVNLDDAVKQAREVGKPIFVIVGAPWCSFCEKLEDEIDEELEAELAKKWVLAKINADEQQEDARELRANALPSLRLLSSDGIVTVNKDGYLSKSALTTWLDDSYAMTKARMPALLTKEIESLDESEIQTLVSLMGLRDVTARRVVLNRLTDMPKKAVAPTIDMLANGKLAEQLSALQLLRQWKAPVEGIDPWEPETIDADAIEAVMQWSKQKFTK